MTAWIQSTPDESIGQKWTTDDAEDGIITLGRAVETDTARRLGLGLQLKRATETDLAGRAYGDTDIDYYDELVIASAPIAYYRLGETAGTTMLDSSGFKRNGTYGTSVTLNAAGLVAEDTDTAAAFTSTANSVSTVNYASWMDLTQITVAAIIRPTNVLNEGTIVSRLNYSQGYGPAYSWSMAVANNQLFVQVFCDNTGNNARFSYSGVELSANKTYHVAFSYSGTQLKIWIDGRLVHTAAHVGVLTTGTEPIRIGRTGSTTTARYQGTIDEVAIYNRVLTDAEMKRQAEASKFGVSATVIDPELVQEVESIFAPTLATELGQVTETESSADASALYTYSLGFVEEIESIPNITIPVLTETNNRVGGRVRQSVGTYEWEPSITNPPADHDIAIQYDTLNVISGVTYPFADSQPVYTVTTARKKRARDRILVGNKDITWWRGAATPMPDFQLIEPMMYGPASMDIPQAAVPFEVPGKGALSFMRKGAPVKVQRVDDTGKVIATDYKGFITAYRISGGELSLDIGGELSGRAGLQNRQVPLFKSYKDIGWFVYHAVRGLVPMAPRLGPVTGIMAYSFGGMSLADYINELVTMGQKTDGTIYSLMPDSKGVYRLEPKDKTTIHATVYFDDERMKPDMNQDMAEEPNRIYATGVTPAGVKIKFGVYPGVLQGPPPPYPYNDNRAFGQGTTDAMTDTGDGISVMINKLAVHKYIDYSSSGYPGGYDADLTKAIKRLQKDAGLPQTGNMNLKTWRALYDQDATGFSLNWSHIEPAAQASYTRPWFRTGSGAVRRKNPAFDPSRLKVDFNIDVGTGFTRGQIRDFAEVELREESNWIGSVESRLAVHKGVHTPGDSVEASDVMSLRDVRPGMNLWAPLFDGGTLFHVSGVSVSDQGRSVSLVLDTQFRDTMKVWQIIERNFETRMDPARAWVESHRRSQMTNDTMITWDEIGGVIDGSVKLRENTWTVFPVLAGQEGTIQRLKIRTNPNAEFCTAMFGYKINAKKLTRLIGDPLTKEGALNWQDPVILNKLDEENVMIYIAGNQEAPCGYYPYDKQDGGTLTGNWEDDAGIAYRTFKHPVIYVAVWSDRNCVIPAGRILWPQQEEGS